MNAYVSPPAGGSAHHFPHRLLHAPATRFGQTSLWLFLASALLFALSQAPLLARLGLALEPGSLPFGAYIAILMILTLSAAVAAALSATMAAMAILRSGERSLMMAFPVIAGLVIAILALAEVFIAQ